MIDAESAIKLDSKRLAQSPEAVQGRKKNTVCAYVEWILSCLADFLLICLSA